MSKRTQVEQKAFEKEVFDNVQLDSLERELSQRPYDACWDNRNLLAALTGATYNNATKPMSKYDKRRYALLYTETLNRMSKEYGL